MAGLSVEALLNPLSPDRPCGPDLEASGDADFMRFQARIEGILPASFFDFDPHDIDFALEFKTMTALLARSVDLRILVPFAKLSILDQNLDDYVAVFEVIATLLDRRWNDLNPPPIEDDPFARIIALQALDDFHDSVMPLQTMPLLKSRRFGAISFRQHLLASGTLTPRKNAHGDDETFPSLSDLRLALAEAPEDEIVARRDLVFTLIEAIASIEASMNAKGGADRVRFGKIRPLARNILSFLEDAVIARDPSKGRVNPENGTRDSTAENASPAHPESAFETRIETTRQARSSLQGAADYFALHEPSSPTRLLLAQAQVLIGRSFYDALVSLVPDHAAKASVKLVGDLPLTLPISQISQLLPADADAEAGEGSPEAVPLPANRNEALSLLKDVAQYFRAKEPSSPVPCLLDQARHTTGKDFIGLLRDMLPQAALRIDT